MSLREKLKALEELQTIDLEAAGVRGEAASLPVRRAELEVEVEASRRVYEGSKARLDDNERERRQIETLLGQERDKVKKWEGRLSEIRTPREYAALSREIDISRKSNETQSEQARSLVAAATELQKAIELSADALSEKEMAARDELESLARQEAEQAARLAELEARRAEAARLVDPALLSRYENLKRKRAGVAVAPVVGSTCRGCNRNIPPQLSIVLKRADSVESCPNCNRIIYAAEALNPPATAES